MFGILSKRHELEMEFGIQNKHDSQGQKFGAKNVTARSKSITKTRDQTHKSCEGNGAVLRPFLPHNNQLVRSNTNQSLIK